MEILHLLGNLLDIFFSASRNHETGENNYDRGCLITIVAVLAIAIFFGVLFFMWS